MLPRDLSYAERFAMARRAGFEAVEMQTIEATADFAPALDRALAQPGLTLLHLKTDVEQITPATTLTKMNAR